MCRNSSVAAYSLLELLAPRLAASLARATAEDETLDAISCTLPALKLVKGAEPRVPKQNNVS